jgi:hypothetical protein
MEKAWLDKLTDAQKEKLRAINGNAEELITFCKEEKLDLPDDMLEGISGGLYFCTSVSNK